MLVPGRSKVLKKYHCYNLKLGLQGLGDLTVEGGYFPVSSLWAGGALGEKRSLLIKSDDLYLGAAGALMRPLVSPAQSQTRVTCLPVLHATKISPAPTSGLVSHLVKPCF